MGFLCSCGYLLWILEGMEPEDTVRQWIQNNHFPEPSQSRNNLNHFKGSPIHHNTGIPQFQFNTRNGAKRSQSVGTDPLKLHSNSSLRTLHSSSMVNPPDTTWRGLSARSTRITKHWLLNRWWLMAITESTVQTDIYLNQVNLITDCESCSYSSTAFATDRA